MTTVYFVRHAQPNYHNHDDAARELSEKGMRDRLLVSRYLADKGIDAVFSSPYQRAVDTVRDFADRAGLPIEAADGFRERRVGGGWIEDFPSFCRRQWDDFDYKLPGGETLREVQTRNVAALAGVLQRYPEKRVAIGSHGTALSTLINFYDPSFGFADFWRIKDRMPWIVRFDFQDGVCVNIEQVALPGDAADPHGNAVPQG